MMPAVRAYMTLTAVADHGETIWSSPTPDEVDGFAGAAIEAWLATEHEPATIEAAVRAIPDVETVSVIVSNGALEPAAEAPTPAPAAAPVSAPAAPEAEADQPAQAPAAAAPAAPVHAAPAARSTAQTVRVDAERLDQLMHLMGELVVHRTRVESLAVGSGIDGLAEAIGTSPAAPRRCRRWSCRCG